MHVIHTHKDRQIDEFTTKPVSFFVTNKKGGYLALGESFTHLQGLFFFDEKVWSPFKVVENFILNDKLTAIRNNLSSVDRLYENGAREEFLLFNNSLIYDVKNYVGEIVFDLDFRHSFDYSDKGRIYSIDQDSDGTIIVKYDKYEDDSLTNKKYTKFLAISGVKSFTKLNSWDKKFYSYDNSRGSKSEFYTFKAFSIPINKESVFTISLSDDKEKAIRDSKSALRLREKCRDYMQNYIEHSFPTSDVALACAQKSFDDLITTLGSKKDESAFTGIFAGYPWFFQFWSRDELLSIKALIIDHKYDNVKKMLMDSLNLISQDGLVPNRLPESDIKSIDAVGWLFVRIYDLLYALSVKNAVDDYFSFEELSFIRQMLEKSIQGLITNHTKDGFVVGSMQESWMDTKEAARDGAFIESQAFLLNMMKLHTQIAKITKSKQLFVIIEKEFSYKVKHTFFENKKLRDSLFCTGIIGTRPNIFLACYVYPELLSRDEWKIVFDGILEELWLGWGGLATLNQHNPAFVSEYTGENDKSYHNGDSWFFINNIAAICLYRIDAKKYERYITRILHASKEELLFSGFVGCSAEVSSAKDMRSQGCLSQAWSIATLIELMYELHPHKFEK